MNLSPIELNSSKCRTMAESEKYFENVTPHKIWNFLALARQEGQEVYEGMDVED